MKNVGMMDGGENITIKPGVPQGKNSCEAKCEIGIDDDGLWYAKWTCPLHPDYRVLFYYDREGAKEHGKKGTVNTTKDVHHWANTVQSFMYKN